MSCREYQTGQFQGGKKKKKDLAKTIKENKSWKKSFLSGDQAGNVP